MKDLVTTLGNVFFNPNAYQCSPESYAFLYWILAIAVIISAGGIYVWCQLFVFPKTAAAAPKPMGKLHHILANYFI